MKKNIIKGQQIANFQNVNTCGIHQNGVMGEQITEK